MCVFFLGTGFYLTKKKSNENLCLDVNENSYMSRLKGQKEEGNKFLNIPFLLLQTL